MVSEKADERNAALAIDLPPNANPAPDAVFMPAREYWVLGVSLIGSRLGEKNTRRWGMGEVPTLALVTGLEVRELAGLVAVSGGSTYGSVNA